MKFFRCGTCDKILEEKYAGNHPKSAITWYNATEHEDRIKEVDELQENSNEEKLEEEKKKRLESYRAELEDMDRDELDDLLESLRAEIHELRKKLNPETDEDKQSRKASLEYLATGSPCHNTILGDHLLTGASVTKQSNYSVLMLDQSYRDNKPGDKLLIRLGSAD